LSRARDGELTLAFYFMFKGSELKYLDNIYLECKDKIYLGYPKIG